MAKWTWLVVALVVAAALTGCSTGEGEFVRANEDPAPDSTVDAEGERETTTVSGVADGADAFDQDVDEEASGSEGMDEPSVGESNETVGATRPSGGFTATIGGARYETDDHDCFELGDGAIAVNGEGSGPSGPFQFFMQAGQAEELSFSAGEFVVFALPEDTDLRFVNDAGTVRGEVTLAVDKILVIEGQCGPSESTQPASPIDAAALLDRSDAGMVASLDGSVYGASSYGCTAAPGGGVAITGTGITDEGLFVTMYIEAGRNTASLSVDGIDIYVSELTGQGTIAIDRTNDVVTVDAVDENGVPFSMAVQVCEGF